MSDPQKLRTADLPVIDADNEAAKVRAKSEAASGMQVDQDAWGTGPVQAAESATIQAQLIELHDEIAKALAQLKTIDGERYGDDYAKMVEGGLQVQYAKIDAEPDELGKETERHHVHKYLSTQLLHLRGLITSAQLIEKDRKPVTPPPLPERSFAPTKTDDDLGETLAGIRKDIEQGDATEAHANPETLKLVQEAHAELAGIQEQLDKRAQASVIAARERLAALEAEVAAKSSAPLKQDVAQPLEGAAHSNELQKMFGTREEFNATVKGVLDQSQTMTKERRGVFEALAEKIWNGYVPTILDGDGKYLHTQILVQRNIRERDKQRVKPEDKTDTALSLDAQLDALAQKAGPPAAKEAALAPAADAIVEELPPVDIEALRAGLRKLTE